MHSAWCLDHTLLRPCSKRHAGRAENAGLKNNGLKFAGLENAGLEFDGPAIRV